MVSLSKVDLFEVVCGFNLREKMMSGDKDTKTEQIGAEEMEDEVMNALPNLDASRLEAVCAVIELQLEENIKGKKKELRKKVETQCKSFDGKGKLTVDDYYSVLKVQVTLEGVLQSTELVRLH